MLSEEFEKEINSLKGIVKLLENRLEDSEKKVVILEDKLGKRKEVVENGLEIEIKCKVCEFKCESKQNMKKHMKENHPSKIECNFCAKCSKEIRILKYTLRNIMKKGTI